MYKLIVIFLWALSPKKELFIQILRITEVGSNAGEGTAFGFQLNLDFTSDLSGILWKDFVGLPGYPEVGAYEGGSQYQYGVWRSEENSCMNNNIPYYNIQSRWIIYRRIKQLAGLPYSVSDFLSMDKVTKFQGQQMSAPALHEFVPLARPKMIKD